ncbi:hypothetical protein BHE74_00006631, partial [Ensete ventricosum]
MLRRINEEWRVAPLHHSIRTDSNRPLRPYYIGTESTRGTDLSVGGVTSSNLTPTRPPYMTLTTDLSKEEPELSTR